MQIKFFLFPNHFFCPKPTLDLLDREDLIWLFIPISKNTLSQSQSSRTAFCWYQLAFLLLMYLEAMLRAGESTGLGVEEPRFESYFCHWFTVSPWKSHFLLSKEQFSHLWHWTGLQKTLNSNILGLAFSSSHASSSLLPQDLWSYASLCLKCSSLPFFCLLIPPYPSALSSYTTYSEKTALAGMGQWIEHWPVNHRVAGSIPSQGTCLGCGPGPW